MCKKVRVISICTSKKHIWHEYYNTAITIRNIDIGVFKRIRETLYPLKLYLFKICIEDDDIDVAEGDSIRFLPFGISILYTNYRFIKKRIIVIPIKYKRN